MQAEIHSFANQFLQPMESHTYYRLPLPAGAHSARHVRRIVRTYLSLWDMSSLADAAELGVTELLANVVRHVADPRCTVVLRRRRTGVRIEVHDNDPALPCPRDAEVFDEGGRGLALLSAYAHLWGAESTGPESKVVWFDLARAPGSTDPLSDHGVECGGPPAGKA